MSSQTLGKMSPTEVKCLQLNGQLFDCSQRVINVEGPAIGFHHVSILILYFCYRKMEKDEPGGVDSITRDLANLGLSVEAQRACLSQMKSHLTFNKTVADLQEMVKGFPKGEVPLLSQFLLLLTWMNFNPGMDKKAITWPIKCRMKLLLHSQTSTAEP